MRTNHPTRGALARVACLALLASFSVACSTTPKPAPSPGVNLPDYRVGAPDALVVNILPDPIITEQLIVRPDGKITVQLVGDVVASGRTTEQIAADIQQRISRFKRGAVVTVGLVNAQSSTITVLGEVAGPRTFPIGKQMRVAEALGAVGGVTRFASDDDIYVVRDGNPPQVFRIDMQAIRKGDLSTNIQVYGGDIIYAEPTAWAKVGYAVQALLFPFQPILNIARTVAGGAF
ncbi:MAG: polysaccharide biosynthesis/export family protein [Myxococcota bacterium]